MPEVTDRILLDDESFLDVTIDFQMWCSRCGDGICGDVREYARYRKNEFTVFCSKCEKEFDNALNENEELKERIIELEEKCKQLQSEIDYR